MIEKKLELSFLVSFFFIPFYKKLMTVGEMNSMSRVVPLLSLKNVWFAPSGKPEHWLIRNVSLNINLGEIVLLMGPSGSGKTTLLKIMRGLIPHVTRGTWKGNVAINGHVFTDKELFGMAKHLGFVFQEPEFQVVGKNVLHELAFGLELQGLRSDLILDRVLDSVRQWNLTSHAFKALHQLSGGELRLVTLIAVLMMNPSILLCDEILSFLDKENVMLVVHALETLIKEKKAKISLIFATHDIQYLLPFATRVIYMENGEILLDGTPREVLNQLLASPDETVAIPSYYLVESFLEEKGLMRHLKVPLPSPLELEDWSERICSIIEGRIKQEQGST